MTTSTTKPTATELLERIGATYHSLKRAQYAAAEAVEDAIFAFDLDFEVPVFPEVPELRADLTDEDWDAIVEYWDERDHFTVCTGHDVEHWDDLDEPCQPMGPIGEFQDVRELQDPVPRPHEDG